jgi:protein involved in polysaccharide export with SLBB domain
MRAGSGPGNYPNRGDLAEPPLGAPMNAMPAMPVYPGMGTGRGSMMADPNRRLQQGDELTIKIEEDREASIPLIVSHTGEIVVEPLERPVKVAGLTTTQATSTIKSLLEKDYYYHATVRLTLERANYAATMGTVSLSGEVARIGMLPIYPEKPLKLSEAILQAGGLGKYAKGSQVKSMRAKPGGETETILVDYDAIVKKAKLHLDVFLKDGDRIFVPTRFFQY